MNRSQKTYILCEGAVCVALSLALSYLKIPIGLSFGAFGGSIDIVMCPLIFFALRQGAAWGVGAGFVFGTLKYFFAKGFAISWVSILLDYALAYAAVGFAGLMRGQKNPAAIGAIIGCLSRFAVHYLSGVTVYAQYMPQEFMHLPMTTPAVYSLLYNGTYMLPNTVLAIVLCSLCGRAVLQYGREK